MFLSDPLLFAFSLIVSGLILFLQIYYVIILTDLESDYLNAQECCSKLNVWVKPKLGIHLFLTFLLLIHGHWILSLINLPIAAWMLYDIIKTPCGNMGVYDPTEIHSRGQLKRHLRDCMIFIGYYMIFFFGYLYCMIVSLLEGDPINRDDEGLMEF
ncbi:PREDICTED: protein cornichon homolog 4 [Nicrophorus vespilloides]|uniref:Protein cornichon homolog 4 n=1 Tax=Nicrophorus vespilloides TaxID=110193 RepID=A0ABM1N8I0_NICVS|nr:PREDICTED: protein cornichon homolog 4 [Nicrophorus vespilloides]